jgi:hypothetical protein
LEEEREEEDEEGEARARRSDETESRSVWSLAEGEDIGSLLEEAGRGRLIEARCSWSMEGEGVRKTSTLPTSARCPIAWSDFEAPLSIDDLRSEHCVSSRRFKGTATSSTEGDGVWNLWALLSRSTCPTLPLSRLGEAAAVDSASSGRSQWP